MEYKYKPGDVLKVVAYNIGDEIYQQGILYIDRLAEYGNKTTNVYYTKTLKGDIKWICINTHYFDNVNNLYKIETKYLGNFKENKAIKILYGL